MTILAPLDAYRRLAPVYDAQLNPIVHLARRTLPDVLPRMPGKVVADVGAGTGYWAADCRSRGAKTVAIDFCEEMLRQATGDRLIGDARSLPLQSESVDVTICAFTLGYAPECLRELARVTRVSGVVVIADVHPDALRRGWTRSFRVNTDVIHVHHQPYALEDLQCPGLSLTSLMEPHFGESERGFFIQANKADSFEDAARHPAIFIAAWHKTAGDLP